jgi:hypothetical protein
MADYRHHVSGFFVKREEADIAYCKLVDRGLLPEQLGIYDNQTAATDPAPDANSNATLQNLIVDGAIGAAIGTGMGVLTELGLLAANVTLFIASPLLAPLALLGWGASLGGLIGAAIGSENSHKTDGRFANMVQDAIMHGQVVLVAHTFNEKDTVIAQEVIKESVGDFNDMRAI